MGSQVQDVKQHVYRKPNCTKPTPQKLMTGERMKQLTLKD